MPTTAKHSSNVHTSRTLRERLETLKDYADAIGAPSVKQLVDELADELNIKLREKGERQ